MRQPPQIGENRTARSEHPEMYEEMEAGPAEFPPTSLGDATAVSKVRIEYAKESGPIGHVPAPASGEKIDEATTELVDKLGERLAFERAGTRLYDALISKHDAFGTFKGGPSRKDLEAIRRDEHDHFLMLKKVIEELGGDPAAVTPSACVAATAGRGLGDVCTDPRTTLLQCLEAILIAELTDNDAWETLIGVARRAGQRKLERGFLAALETEREHLARVREWVQGGHGIVVGEVAEAE